jgi:hypothetical protein
MGDRRPIAKKIADTGHTSAKKEEINEQLLDPPTGSQTLNQSHLLQSFTGSARVPNPHAVLQLQRLYGNRAVTRMFQRDTKPARPPISPAPGVIQRWNLQEDTIDWQGETQNVEILMSGQPVYFFQDQAANRVVVKGEDAPIGMVDLVSYLHKQIHGTPTPFTKDVTADKATIMGILADPNRTTHESWTRFGERQKGDNPAQAARDFHQGLLQDKPKMQVMTVAPGKNAEKLLEKQNKYYAPFVEYLEDPAYVQRLGEITAVDLFLENQDRVFYNTGNWFTDAKGNITLIDHTVRQSTEMWTSQDEMDEFGGGGQRQEGEEEMPGAGMLNLIRYLTPGRLPALINDLIRVLNNNGLELWLADIHPGGETNDAFVRQNLEIGINRGIDNLISLLDTKKMKRSGRKIKQIAVRSGRQDTQTEGVRMDYWSRLKARARYLKKMRG